MNLSNGVELTAEQIANLRTLAYWHLSGAVYASPMGFDMGGFCGPPNSVDEIAPQKSASACGTIGCLVGHGPMAGIKPRVGENWFDYSERCFIPDSLRGDEWLWCFAPEWESVDNTPEGGAKRILWMLNFGLPRDWLEQLDGVAPLCYRDWTPPMPEPVREPSMEAVPA